MACEREAAWQVAEQYVCQEHLRDALAGMGKGVPFDVRAVR